MVLCSAEASDSEISGGSLETISLSCCSSEEKSFICLFGEGRAGSLF